VNSQIMFWSCCQSETVKSEANNNINNERARDIELNIMPSDKGLLKNGAAWSTRMSDSIHDV
jgi:hypothetical protein